LIQLGHTRIACITNALAAYNASVERLTGYRTALEAAGLRYDEALVRYGDFDPESGYTQMQDLLNGGRQPTAVFVASDVVAIGAMAAIRERGLHIPKDVAVVGYDDIPFSRYTDPPLTTIHLPAFDLGRGACNLLIRLIQHDQPENFHIRLGTHLVIRKSCGAQA
jgi:LacI family transcriptional regulator